MKLKIKVCGMRETENIQDVSKLEPDFMGFIFYEKSPRFVGTEFEIPSINKNIIRVGVFVNHDFDFILDKAEKYDFSFVQLHGNETPEFCGQLKLCGLKIIKAFSVDSNFDFKRVDKYADNIDYFLFDTKGNNYGGTGKTFDWTLLRNYKLTIPFFLSGGLNPANINEVYSIENEFLYALDLNSGFEIIEGKKDISKIRIVINHLNQRTEV